MKEWGDQYTFEPHQTTTDDGYILTLFRLSNTQEISIKTNSSQPVKEPLFMMHGLYSNADNWLYSNTPDSNPLSLQLLDSGFDVWLGN